MEPAAVARTSPSNLRRRQLCPGSARLEAGLPDDESEDAHQGRLLHRYWTNPEYDRSFLSNFQRDLLTTADGLTEEILARLEFAVAPNILDQERLLATQDHAMEGTPDRVYVWPSPDAALVIDLKSGWADNERAELNLQLRGYALLVADNYRPLSRIFVALLQPRRPPREKITMARYDLADVVRSRKQIYKIIDATMDPDAPLVAGDEQCQFCRAKLICPAFREAMSAPIIPYRSDGKLSKAAREAFIERKIRECTDEQLEQVINACRLAGHVADAAFDEARERIKAGRYSRYVLGKESEVRVVGDVRKAIGLLVLAGVITRREVTKMCEFPLGAVEDSYRSQHKGVTWKEARDKIDSVLKSVIEIEKRKPRILPKKI